VAAGHPRDHERELQGVAEEARREIDRGRIDRRERVVEEVDVLPSRGRAGLDVALRRDLQMLAFAPGDLLRV